MTAIPSQIPLVNRKRELEELKNHLSNATQGQGNLVFIAGEAGIGKTRLVDELKTYAQSQGIQVLQGWSLYESLAPYMPFIEALRSANLEHLFSREEPPKVECVYLISSTGLLVKDVVREETKLDSTIFAGMLTAVGDFVKDSLTMLSGEERKETLDSLGYEKYRILIESGKNTNLVVILTGRENEFLVNDMKEVLANVNQDYGNVLKAWDGDDNSVKGIENFLKPLITSGKFDGIDYAKDDPKVKRNRLFENILLGIERHSKLNPSLLCIEDLQWTDPSSLALMHYIARNTRKCNLLILGTYRPEDVAAPEEGMSHPLIKTMQMMSREELYHKIDLERLEEGHVDEMRTSLLGKTNFTDEFKKHLYNETEGNPFFIVELIRMLVEEKTIERKDDIWILTKKLEEMNIPSKVHDVIERRLNRVKEDMREILDCASVIGEEFTSKLISPVLGINRMELLKTLKTLEQKHRLIRSYNGSYKFDHAKIKEVLYSEIPAELKMEYHALIADSIETLNKDNLDEVIEDLAFHFYHCKNRIKALPYLLKAAEKAKKDYSNEEAIRFYNQALEIEEDERNRREIFEALGDIYDLIGDYGRSIESYKNALGLTKGNRKMAEIRVKIGDIYWRKGEYNESQKICTEALALVRGKRCKEEAFSIEIIGIIHWRKGEYNIALERLEKGLEIYTEINDQEGVATSLNNLSEVYGRLGDYDKALEYYKKSLKIMKNIGDLPGIANCFGYIGHWHFSRGEYGKALEYFEKSLEKRDKIGDQQGIAVSLNYIGQAYRCKGENNKAFEYLEESMEICEKIVLPWTLGDVLNEIGRIYFDLGEYDKALEHLKRSLKISEELGLQSISAWNFCNLSETYLKKRNIKRALDFCARALDLSKDMGYKWPLGASKRAFGMIYREQKKWNESIENFNESIKVFGEINMKHELGDSCYEFGLMWKEKGDSEKAKEYLNKALNIYEKLKLEKHMEKVRKEL